MRATNDVLWAVYLKYTTRACDHGSSHAILLIVHPMIANAIMKYAISLKPVVHKNYVAQLMLSLQHISLHILHLLNNYYFVHLGNDMGILNNSTDDSIVVMSRVV